jgi:glutamate 5-kinase
LTRRGKEIVLVSSGAIAEGMQRLGWAVRPKAIHELQAAAAVGQMGLVQAYEAAFGKFGLKTAQVLLTVAAYAGLGFGSRARQTVLLALTALTLLVLPTFAAKAVRHRKDEGVED